MRVSHFGDVKEEVKQRSAPARSMPNLAQVRPDRLPAGFAIGVHGDGRTRPSRCLHPVLNAAKVVSHIPIFRRSGSHVFTASYFPTGRRVTNTVYVRTQR